MPRSTRTRRLPSLPDMLAPFVDWIGGEWTAKRQADRLVRPLVTLHRKGVHCSGGKLELGRGLGGTAFAPSGGFEFASFAFGGAVAVSDVERERVAVRVPVEVVGVFADELVDRAEGA